jgi:hypothetical protein
VLFWVIPRRLKFICRSFGTFCLFHLHRQVDSTHIYLPMKMEETECSETSAYKLQTPRYYPKEIIQTTEHGERLKSRIYALIYDQPFFWSLNEIVSIQEDSYCLTNIREVPLWKRRFKRNFILRPRGTWSFPLRPRGTWSFPLRPRGTWSFPLRPRGTWSFTLRPQDILYSDTHTILMALTFRDKKIAYMTFIIWQE